MCLLCRFKRETWDPLSKQLSHIALFWYSCNSIIKLVCLLIKFSVLFNDEMPSLVDYTVEDLEKTFKR